MKSHSLALLLLFFVDLALPHCAFGQTNAAASPQNQYDVYLLAGQSNMDGRGLVSKLSAEQQKPIDNAIIFYRNAGRTSDGWQKLAPGFSVPPKYKGDFPSPTFGPEIGFAQSMLKADPNRKLALIKGSKGGTNLRADWKPGVRGDKESGLGREGIRFAIEDMTEIRNLVIRTKE